MNEIVSLISSVGFPIVACIGLGYFLSKIITRLLDQLDKFGDSLDKFNDTLITLDNRVAQIEDKIQ